MDDRLAEAIVQLYRVVHQYPRPRELAVCPRCAVADVDPARLAAGGPSRPLSWRPCGDSLLSLPDNVLRHFLPRVLEVLLGDRWAAFEFGLKRLKGRTTGWPRRRRRHSHPPRRSPRTRANLHARPLTRHPNDSGTPRAAHQQSRAPRSGPDFRVELRKAVLFCPTAHSLQRWNRRRAAGLPMPRA